MGQIRGDLKSQSASVGASEPGPSVGAVLTLMCYCSHVIDLHIFSASCPDHTNIFQQSILIPQCKLDVWHVMKISTWRFNNSEHADPFKGEQKHNQVKAQILQIEGKAKFPELLGICSLALPAHTPRGCRSSQGASADAQARGQTSVDDLLCQALCKVYDIYYCLESSQQLHPVYLLCSYSTNEETEAQWF